MKHSRIQKFFLIFVGLICALSLLSCSCGKEKENKKLSTPSISLSGSVLSWASVKNAQSYEIYADNVLVGIVSSNQVDLKNISVHYGNHNYTVKAKGAGFEDSSISNEMTYLVDYTDLSVRNYTGANGVVAAASPYAAKVGLDILEAGGNAFDAAVAVSFALGVVEPNASGLGGGGFMVAYDATSKKYVGYNFREFYPGNGTLDNIPAGKNLKTTAGNVFSVGVPTQVAGLLGIENDLGVLNLSDVINPAIDYAENGFVVTEGLNKNIKDNWDRMKFYNSEYAWSVFSEDGFEPGFSETGVLVQTDYATSLKKIRDEGLDGFYTGTIADAIIASVGTGNGGLMTQSDLDYAKANYPIKFEPVVGNYKGYTVVSANAPSSGGVVLIEALNMLDSYFGQNGLRQLGHNSSEYINAVATALWLGYGDKNKYVADYLHDTSLVNVISGLTNYDYASSRYALCYQEGQAYYNSVAYGDPTQYVKGADMYALYTDNDDALGHYSTTTFSVADKDGNIVTFTQTINLFFGCGLMPEGTGFYMNNQCSDLSLDPNSVHCVKPYKQPVSSMMPTIVLDPEGKPWATLGSPGSNRIQSAVMQVLLNCIEFGMDMQEAINAPRFYYYPDHSYAYIEVEQTGDITSEIVQGLQTRGYTVNVYNAVDEHFGGVQGIKFNNDGTLTGGADIRRDGKALGY